MLLDLLYEVRMRQRGPADSDQRGMTIANIACPEMHRKILEPAISTANDRKAWQSVLDFGGGLEVT